MDNQTALENYAIELNFTKSLTCRLIKLNELDRDKSRWSFSIGRRLRHSDNFTMPRLLSSMRALLECECNVFESFSFTNSPAFSVLLFSLMMFQHAQPHPLLNYKPHGLFFSYSGCATYIQ